MKETNIKNNIYRHFELIEKAFVTAIFFLTLTSNTIAQEPRAYMTAIEVNWFDGNSKFWYKKNKPDGKHQFILVDTKTGEKNQAFDHEKVAVLIGEQTLADSLPIDELKFLKENQEIHLISNNGTSWIYIISTNTLKISPESKNSANGINPETDISSSINAGGNTTISFINKLDKEVYIYWVNHQGESLPYGSLKSGEQHDQGTFVGHFWLIKKKGKHGKPIAAFRAINKNATAIIHENVPEPKEIETVLNVPKTVKSPNGEKEAFVKNDNLWIRDIKSKSEIQLSTDGISNFSYHRDAVRTRAMNMQYNHHDFPKTLPEVYWSPDSKNLIAIRTKVVSEPRVYLTEKRTPINH